MCVCLCVCVWVCVCVCVCVRLCVCNMLWISLLPFGSSQPHDHVGFFVNYCYNKKKQSHLYLKKSCTRISLKNKHFKYLFHFANFLFYGFTKNTRKFEWVAFIKLMHVMRERHCVPTFAIVAPLFRYTVFHKQVAFTKTGLLILAIEIDLFQKVPVSFYCFTSNHKAFFHSL